MKIQYLFSMLVILVLLLLIDTYTYKGIILLTSGMENARLRIAVRAGYWLLTAIVFATIIFLFLFTPHERDPGRMSRVFLIASVILAIYLPKLLFIVFHLAEDLGKLFSLGLARLFHTGPESFSGTAGRITRARFLSQIGIILAAVPFFSVILGILRGRFNYQVSREVLHWPNLPAAFDRIRIVQISDFHIGSFYGYRDQVEKAVRMVNGLDPDILVFTGDMVNDYYEELEGWIPLLGSLEAKLGKYSILGNHDYGDYYRWDSMEEKLVNLEKMKKAHELMGFRLLLNDSAVVEKDGEKFAILGVENWGKPPFAQYGDLKKASLGMKDMPFKLLLTHDPSHWDAEVLGKTDIDLTLSGHTHGMQFGIRAGNMQWSPVSWKYPRWAGLYREGKQVLYVNRGIGYIGFAGRVGMPPEITVFELERAPEVT